METARLPQALAPSLHPSAFLCVFMETASALAATLRDSLLWESGDRGGMVASLFGACSEQPAVGSRMGAGLCEGNG